MNKTLCSRFWNILESFITNEKQFIESIKAGNIPIIKSVKEIELYLEHKIKDEEIAVIVADVLKRIGEDGVMEIKKGWDGNPYRVEYFSNDLPPNISRKEADKQIDKLRSELKNYNLSEGERERISEEIKQLVRQHAIIWINAISQADFDNKRDLIMKSFGYVTEALTRKKDV